MALRARRRRPDQHAAGDPEVAIEPRVEQHAAVDLDAELRVALGGVLGVRLEAQVRAVGVRADDAEPGALLRRREHEREQVRAAARHVVRAGREPVPAIGLVEPAEAGGLEPAAALVDGVERRGRGAQEREQVAGDFGRHAETICVLRRRGERYAAYVGPSSAISET